MLRWGILALAVVVALVAWLVTRGGGDSGEESEPAPKGFEAKIVDEAELEDIAASAEHSVYWAGAMEGKELEASEDEQGNVQVRYLDDGAEVGAESQKAITIGSYPVKDPSGYLDNFAKEKGAIVIRAPDGRKLVSNVKSATSVYFASPDNSVQVEVYAPNYKRALSLARSGKVEPVG